MAEPTPGKKRILATEARAIAYLDTTGQARKTMQDAWLIAHCTLDLLLGRAECVVVRSHIDDAGHTVPDVSEALHFALANNRDLVDGVNHWEALLRHAGAHRFALCPQHVLDYLVASGQLRADTPES